jgi:hypothetical protein
LQHRKQRENSQKNVRNQRGRPAIIAADPLWGPDQDWQLLIDQTTTEVGPPAPPQFGLGDNEEPTTPPAHPDEQEPTSTAEKHGAELAAFEADLQDLFHP